MTTISPIIAKNISHPKQGNVIPTAPKKATEVNTTSFKGNYESGKSTTGVWVLGTLAVLGGLAFIFRKNLKLGKTALKGIKDLTEKKETYTWAEAEKHVREVHGKVKDHEKSSIIKISDELKKGLNLGNDDALQIGYFKKGGKDFVLTKIISYKKLDSAFTEKFNNNESIVINWTK